MKSVYPDSAIVGGRIREIRKERKLSQTDLAKFLKKSLRTIQKYESGQIDLTISTINQIAFYLSVSPASLLGYDPYTPSLQTVSDFAAYLFELDKKEEVRFEIKTEMEHSCLKCSIIFNGLDQSAKHNTNICQLLSAYQVIREEFTYHVRSAEDYERWKQFTLDFYNMYSLHNRHVDEPD